MAKHLNKDDMKFIERGLDKATTLEELSNCLDRDSRGMSRHIKKYRIIKVDKRSHNKCAHQYECEIKHLCDSCFNGKCAQCKLRNCNNICGDYCEVPCCKKLSKYPFVCNGCENQDKCKMPKYLYDSEVVYKEAMRNLKEPRSHIHASTTELSLYNEILERCIDNGLSLEVILDKNPEIKVSLSTLYTYINLNLFSRKNIDLKRKVRYKPRKTSKTPFISYNYLKNRYYEDFISHLVTHPNNIVWEMDTIEGRKGGKAVLSLLERRENLQLFFLIDKIDTDSIISVFRMIRDKIKDENFKKYFQVILTDRGKEFKDPLSIELDEFGNRLTYVFYCDSRQSQQKGKCEKNHEIFRELEPKGTSFDQYDNEIINYDSNMVNNYPRPSLNFKSPYEIASVLLHKKILELNELAFVDFKDLKLK